MQTNVPDLLCSEGAVPSVTVWLGTWNLDDTPQKQARPVEFRPKAEYHLYLHSHLFYRIMYMDFFRGNIYTDRYVHSTVLFLTPKSSAEKRHHFY
jgi:hypothetical protein